MSLRLYSFFPYFLSLCCTDWVISAVLIVSFLIFLLSFVSAVEPSTEFFFSLMLYIGSRISICLFFISSVSFL